MFARPPLNSISCEYAITSLSGRLYPQYLSRPVLYFKSRRDFTSITTASANAIAVERDGKTDIANSRTLLALTEKPLACHLKSEVMVNDGKHVHVSMKRNGGELNGDGRSVLRSA